jgi:hypothetical protein
VRENTVFIKLAVSIVNVPVAAPVMNDDTVYNILIYSDIHVFLN